MRMSKIRLTKTKNQRRQTFFHAAFVAKKEMYKIKLNVTNFVCGKSMVIPPASTGTLSANAAEIKTLAAVFYHVIKIFIVVNPKNIIYLNALKVFAFSTC